MVWPFGNALTTDAIEGTARNRADALGTVPSDAALSISLTKRIRELGLGLPGLAIWQLQELRLRRERRAMEIDREAV